MTEYLPLLCFGIVAAASVASIVLDLRYNREIRADLAVIAYNNELSRRYNAATRDFIAGLESSPAIDWYYAQKGRQDVEA